MWLYSRKPNATPAQVLRGSADEDATSAEKSEEAKDSGFNKVKATEEGKGVQYTGTKWFHMVSSHSRSLNYPIINIPCFLAIVRLKQHLSGLRLEQFWVYPPCIWAVGRNHDSIT